ncbi:rho GTPase-activating protein 12 [Elysia marginata]|uniref:Rho GTPase-activating protein 12 n=1 Tax=Elysia marginata TaxID=1093978 RepID=A0AAV4IUB4_9GAST|nr:rho GTPase-activating protein 12 [Elysia marginata]
MTEVLDQVVKVLYDYKYSDDAGEIEIRTGDIYRLVEKTNNEWWQVYDPSDADGESFFVPAQYVEIVHDESPWKALSDLDKALTFGDDRSASPDPDYNDDPSDLYSTAASATSGMRLVIHDTDESYVNIDNNGERGADDSQGEYINLDSYRTAAGIPSLATGGPGPPGNQESSAATKPNIPQELIQGTVPPPLPEEGTYVKVLLEGLPWDIYREHTAGRLFYVNRETKERMWKPPRKPTPHQSEPKTPEETSTRFGSTSTSGNNNEPAWSGLPPQYEQVHDNGNIYFIHRGTQEKWKSLVDKIGRQYFHKLGSADTQWTLPDTSEDKLLRSHISGSPKGSEQILQQQDVNWERQGHRLSTFGGQPPPLSRSAKASSTYGQLEPVTKPGNRASTLPANFTVARPAPVAHERGLGPPPSQVQQLPSPSSNSKLAAPASEEVLAGYLNKAKILDTGKKKVKKNWAQIYLVLRGSNLIFYKDQKSASNDGRNEGVVSLQGAHVNFNPPKDLTSRKNSILLQASSGNLFLFQSDNEKNIREWFTRMKIVANDVSSVNDSSPNSFDVKEEKKDDKKPEKTTHRSVSSDDSVDKNKNLVGIRAKLLSLISRRPTQEDLYKRGIIKDAVFGSRLHELCDKEKTHVPNFVHKCILAVESKGLMHDGLYRVSGNMAEIQRLRCAVDKDNNYNLYDEQWDVNVLTGSLKLFFRELKEPVFPFHMYNIFIQAIAKDNAKERLSAFKKAVSDLPRCNYFTLKELFHHLCKIIEYSHENRMQVQNVAIVFGPTLMWQQEEGGSLAVSTMYQSKIVEYMLLEYATLFKH